VALTYNRPVVLGDQRINITVSGMQSALKETLEEDDEGHTASH